MIVSLIVAVDNNFGIGIDNKLPWGRVKDDMAFFKETTLNSTVIMGRNTFESIGSKPLVSRKNIVLTSSVLNTEVASENLVYMNSLTLALTSELLLGSSREVFIIGGATVYDESMKYADRLYITHIPDNFNCDTFFPTINEELFSKKKIKTIEYNNQNADIYLYSTYKLR